MRRALQGLAVVILCAGLASAADGAWHAWSAHRQNRRIDALLAGHDGPVDPDAPAAVRAAEVHRLLARGDIDQAQAIADRMTAPADAPVRAALLYQLGNAQLRHALTIFKQVPFRIVRPIIVLAKGDYRQAIALDPDNWDARYNFALAGALVRDTEQGVPTAGDEMSHERATWPDVPGAPNGMP